MRQFGLRRSLPTLAALVGMAILATALPARADIGIDININGNTLLHTTSGGPTLTINTPVTLNGLTVTQASATGNSPGTPATSNLLNSTLALDNAAASTANTLVVTYSANNYTQPTAPPPLTFISQLGGAINAIFGGGTTLTFQSWVNPNNQLFATTGGVLTSGPQTVTLGGTGAFTVPNFTGTIPALSPSYSFTSRVTATLALQGAAAGQLNWAGNTSLVSVVPEPAPIALALTGLPALGLLWARRRREQA